MDSLTAEVAPTLIAILDSMLPRVLICPLLKTSVGLKLAPAVILCGFAKVPLAIVNVLLASNCNMLFAVILRPPLKVALFVVKRRKPLAPEPSPKVNSPPAVVVREEKTTTFEVLVETRVPPLAPMVTLLKVTSEMPPATFNVPPLMVKALALDVRLAIAVISIVPSLIQVPPV